MRESAEDIDRLQALLDRSYDHAGENLLGVHSQGRRLSAQEISERLQGPRWLVVATVSSDGRPFTAQVDGTFYRGQFYFGVNDKVSLKARHLNRNSAISATHVPDDQWVVTVHGRAQRVDVGRNGEPGLIEVLVDTYKQRYGLEWNKEALSSGPIYFSIEAERMFALDLAEVRNASRS